MQTNTISRMKVFAVVALMSMFLFTQTASAQVNYQTYNPQSQAETIAYLQGIIAQLLAQLQAQQQYGTTDYYYRNQYGQVLGTSYSGRSYTVDVGTSFLRHDDDDITLYGTIDLNDASYAYVWFEYGDSGLDEHTSRERVTRDQTFSETIDEDEFEEGEWNYYRAVAESPSGHRDYGVTRGLYVSDSRSSRSSSRYDDEPVAETERAYDIEDDRATIEGGIDMNDFRNGIVFFVYGEDEDQVEDIEHDYDEYNDIDEDGDDLQKVKVDSDLDGVRDYWRIITGLDDDTEYFFQICVEYEDDDDDEVIECGGVEDFETDR